MKVLTMRILIWLLAVSINCGHLVTTVQSQADRDDSGEHRRALYRASLAAAEKSLRLQETADARRWLDQAPTELRGWEWRFLNAQMDDSIHCTKTGGVTVTSLATSPDGTTVATADSQGRVELRHAATLEVMPTIGDHADAVYTVHFSPNSRRLTTVSRDATARVWDLETCAEFTAALAESRRRGNGLRTARSTCGDLQLAHGEEDQQTEVHGVVWLWNPETGEVAHQCDVGVKPLDSLAWSQDGSQLVVGSWDGLVHVLDAAGEVTRTLEMPPSDVYNAVIAVAFSPDGHFVAAGSKDRTARVWDVSDGRLVATLQGHSGFVNQVLFTPDSQGLVTSSVDGTVRRWRILDGRQVQLWRGHLGSVDELVWPDHTQTLITASRDGTLRVWDTAATRDHTVSFLVKSSGTYTTVFDSHGSRIHIANYDGHVRTVDAKTGEILADWEAHPDSSCNTLALRDDGKTLVTCSWDRTARLWDAGNGQRLAEFTAGGGIYDCDISADGSFVALCVGHDIEIWDVKAEQKVAVCRGHDQQVNDVVFSPDGQLLASAANETAIRLWNAASAECMATLDMADGPSSSVEFSPDGKIVAGGGAGKVILWNVASHRKLRNYTVGDRSIHHLAFTPDSRRLAVAADALSILDPAHDEVLLRLMPQNDDIYFLAFSPDGRRLASCTTGGSLVILNAPMATDSPSN